VPGSSISKQSHAEPLGEERQDLVTRGDRRLTRFVDQVGAELIARFPS
jgi:hypothetical protein